MDTWLIIVLAVVGIIVVACLITHQNDLRFLDKKRKELEELVKSGQKKSEDNDQILKGAIKGLRTNMVLVQWKIAPLANGKFSVNVFRPYSEPITLVGDAGDYGWCYGENRNHELVNVHVATLGEAQQKVIDTLMTVGNESIIGKKGGDAKLEGRMWV